MGVFERFASIMSANINALLDKCEDPAKMIDQYLRDAMEDLADVKRETAKVMAVEKRAKREYDEHLAEVEKYAGLAKKALAAGNEDDARVFVSKKQALDARTDSIKKTYDTAHANAQKLRQMHDKLVGDIENLKSRRDNVKATMAVANTQKTINKMGTSADKIAGSMGAFERMESKAEEMLDMANAEAELNEAPADEAAELAGKYEAGESDASVDAELAAMKAELGL